MLKINIREYSRYYPLWISYNGVNFDEEFLSKSELKGLLEILKTSVKDIEYILSEDEETDA